jgi:hypothetical protein
MKTKTNKLANHITTAKSSRRLTNKRHAILESYFSNALVLAALLESAQNSLRAERDLS